MAPLRDRILAAFGLQRIPTKPSKPPKWEAVSMKIIVLPDRELGEEGMLILTDTQKATCTVAPVNSKGNPAPIDGVPQWSSTNPSVATVTPSEDGLTASVVAVGLGVTQINCVADADMDENETREITALLDVEVKASEAVQMGITAGTPEEQ